MIAVARTEGNTDQARRQVRIPIQTWLADEADPNPRNRLVLAYYYPLFPQCWAISQREGPRG